MKLFVDNEKPLCYSTIAVERDRGKRAKKKRKKDPKRLTVSTLKTAKQDKPLTNQIYLVRIKKDFEILDDSKEQ